MPWAWRREERRCSEMSRKRFIKLLMSHGISRNKAVELANYYNRRNIPYERAYKRLIFVRLASKLEMSAIGAFRYLRYLATGRC